MYKIIKQKMHHLLKQAEKYTKTDNAYLIKSLSFIWSYQTFTVLSGLILYYIFANYVPAFTYGKYKYYITLFELFGITTLTGAKISLAPSIARGLDGTLPMLFKKRIRFGIVGSFVCLLGAVIAGLGNNLELLIALSIIATCAPWIHASGLTTSYMSGTKNFSMYAKTNASIESITFLSILATVFIWPTPIMLLTTYLASSSINIIVYFHLLRKLRNNQIDPEAYSLGKYYSVLDGLNIFANRVDSLITYMLLGPANLAIYSFAIIPVEQIRGYLSHIQSVSVAKISVGNYTTLRKSLTARMPILMFGIFLIILFYILTASLIYKYLFPTYQASTIYSQIYSTTLLFIIPTLVYQTLLQSHGKKQISAKLNLVSNTLQICTTLFGAWFYGLMGIIVARCCTSIIIFGITALHIHASKYNQQ